MAGTPAGSWCRSTSASAPPTRAEVRVTWPDGEVGPWLPVEADQVVRIERGATAAAAGEPVGEVAP